MPGSQGPQELAAEQPTHLITRREALAWFAGSAFPRLVTHRTNPDSAGNILSYGVAIRTSGPQPAWGHGFYASTHADSQYGEIGVWVAVRLLRPLELLDTIDGAEVIDGLLARADTEDVRSAVPAAGHDGVMLHLDRDEVWLIAYDDAQVRVIVAGD